MMNEPQAPPISNQQFINSANGDDDRTSGPSHLEPTIYELDQWRWWSNFRPLPSRTNNLWTRPMTMMIELQAPPISNQQSMNSTNDDDDRTSGPSRLEPAIYVLDQWRWWSNFRPLPSRTNNLWTRPMTMMIELQAPPISNQQSMNSTNDDDDRTSGPSHLEPTIYELDQWRWWSNFRPLPSRTNNLWTRPMTMMIELHAPPILNQQSINSANGNDERTSGPSHLKPTIY